MFHSFYPCVFLLCRVSCQQSQFSCTPLARVYEVRNIFFVLVGLFISRLSIAHCTHILRYYAVFTCVRTCTKNMCTMYVQLQHLSLSHVYQCDTSYHIKYHVQQQQDSMCMISYLYSSWVACTKLIRVRVTSRVYGYVFCYAITRLCGIPVLL